MAVVSTAEESSCRPGFESESLIFRVNRKHLKPGTRLGKVGFTDCTDRIQFLFNTDDSHFVLNSDGVLIVQRGVDLHEGHQDFFVHSWDSEGNKMTVPVMVLLEHHYESWDAEQHHGGRRHQNHHNTRLDSASIKETAGHPDVAVRYFPKSSNGLRRRKRDWVIPPFNYPENHDGPFPYKIAQVRSSDDKMKMVTYSIMGPGVDEDPKGLFTMDKDTGDLYVYQRLDREKQANYKVLATDADEPGNDNSIIKYTILSQEPKLPNDHMFTIDFNNGAIMVEDAGLDRETYPEYTLEIQAADMFGEGLTGKTKVVLKVADRNDNAPVFIQSTVSTTCVTLQFKIGSDPAGWLKVDEDTGLVTVKSLMDRESAFVKNDTYTALILSYDDDVVPATGTGTLSITLEDVNDNPPFIVERNITVCRDDSTPVLLTVADKDGPHHSAPYNVMVDEVSKPNWSAQMNTDRTGVELVLKSNELSGTYPVILRVSDTGGLEQDCFIQVKVCSCVENERVCAPLRNGWSVKDQIIWGVVGGTLLLSMVLAVLYFSTRERLKERKRYFIIRWRKQPDTQFQE
ncbi:Cadherin-1 [Oryzias melastigma]|uniref:Cadherin-1 n=1 Tax=Oryzias melastigma TaxID=30732 RepID=A0A834BUL3_ORYME|nr:Cadherin-1 [Oryzias melastigma]